MNKIVVLLIIVFSPYLSIKAQVLSKSDIQKATLEAMPASVEMYKDFLSIPNVSSYATHRNANVEWCVKTFDALGFNTQILTSQEIPHVLAIKEIDPDYKTILFYLQIDGQPVDSTEWHQPHPFIPVLKRYVNERWEIVDWDQLSPPYDDDLRVFARSASDSKGPAINFITALQILQRKGIHPKFNIKVIMDFQEELGSPTLSPLVIEKRELFEAEMMLIMDGTRHLSNLPTLTFGCRGMATVRLEVFGANKNLHSGQYGNYAPNPVFGLSKLIAGMKDDRGRVVIPGFYDGVYLSEKEKQVINSLPEDPEVIKSTLGIAAPDRVGETYQEALQYPSLNVRGLRAAWVDQEVRTIIPMSAVAEIDMRLVVETPAERQIELIRDYILTHGYHIIDSLPTLEERATYPKLIRMTSKIGSKPFRTDMDSDIGKWLEGAMQYVFDDNYVKMRLTGGSQPIAPFITTLNIPAVSIRIPNPDNSIHAPNENMRIGNYIEGIQTCLSLLLQDFN